MFDLEEKTIRLLTFMLTGAVTVLVLVVSLCLLRLLRPISKTVTGTGTYCGHCGSGVPNDPVRVLATADQSYFVYRCPACAGETLLPTQKLHE